MVTWWLARPCVWFFLIGAQDGEHWLEPFFKWIARCFPDNSYLGIYTNVQGVVATVLVSLVCGAVGSLVVSNRMAFFSDALAHCAFAGAALGLLIALVSGVRTDFWQWITPTMITFGIVVGLGIAWVREKTSLASDTVIGVFFAGAIGLAAVLSKLIRKPEVFNLEGFLFGDPVTVSGEDLVLLLVLTLVTAGLLFWMYNQLVFTSFNSSLARSRRIPIRFCNYLFIVLLALIVNVCFKAVGVLLINALLIVPAATVGNVARNIRQLFWGTIFLCLLVSALGLWVSAEVTFRDPTNPTKPIYLGIGGTMIVLSVFFFYLSMLVTPLHRIWQRNRLKSLPASPGADKV